MQIEKEKKSRNPNPNPNPRGKGTPDLLGLCVTHGRTCAGRMSAALAKRALHSKQPLAVRDAGGTSARARAQGTTARPLDGVALSHGRSARAGEGADGGAGHAFPQPPWTLRSPLRRVEREGRGRK